MPPQPKLTRTSALEAAVQLVREGGLDAVNARALAKRLGTSTNPLFRLFTNMDELKRALIEELNARYNAFMDARMTDENRLVSQGIAYISFAREEPRIFNELFMNRTMAGSTLQDVARAEWNHATIENIQALTGCGRPQAETVFLNVWLYAHGIATQIVSNQIVISPDEVSDLVEEAFRRFLAPSPL